MAKQELENQSEVSEGVIYIIKKEDRYLLTKRIKSGSNFYGEFLFPAGRIEADDASEFACVQREIAEERGAGILAATKIDSVTYLHPSGSNITQHIYLVEQKNIDGEIVNKEPEKEELFWVTLEEADQLCRFEGARIVLKKLIEFVSARQDV
jgi:8-oxo-dGTP pyrophosphatase MutT (NUDIX family)